MNNPSSRIALHQNSASLASLFGPELSPMITGLQHITSQHSRIDVESVAIFLRLVRSGEQTMPEAEAAESAEGLTFLENAQLITVNKASGASYLALTEPGRRLAAEVMGIFEAEASPLQ